MPLLIAAPGLSKPLHCSVPAHDFCGLNSGSCAVELERVLKKVEAAVAKQRELASNIHEGLKFYVAMQVRAPQVLRCQGTGQGCARCFHPGCSSLERGDVHASTFRPPGERIRIL